MRSMLRMRMLALARKRQLAGHAGHGAIAMAPWSGKQGLGRYLPKALRAVWVRPSQLRP